MKMKTPTSRLVSKIKRMMTTSKKKRKSPDPITRFRGRIEYDCATKILDFVLNELVEPQKVTEQAAPVPQTN